MSYDDGEAGQEENGIEVILRTIEEEQEDATLAAQSSNVDQGDDDEHPCTSPPSGDHTLAAQSSNCDQNDEDDDEHACISPLSGDHRSIPYHPTRPFGDKEDKAEIDEVELFNHDHKKQRHGIVHGGTGSGKLDDETRDVDELQCLRRLGDQDDNNATTTEVAGRTRSEELDTSISSVETKSDGTDSAVVTVVLYRQEA
jgi:hypothetical protein